MPPLFADVQIFFAVFFPKIACQALIALSPYGLDLAPRCNKTLAPREVEASEPRQTETTESNRALTQVQLEPAEIPTKTPYKENL
jgi:hypothetical protein